MKTDTKKTKELGSLGASVATLVMASLPVIPVHDGFVTPASYLRRPRGHSKPMAPAEPESAVERDQRLGLVSDCHPLCFTSPMDAFAPTE